MPTTRILVLPLVTACTVALGISAPASAGVVDAGGFHDEFSFDEPDYCGTGLEVHVDATFDLAYRVVDRNGDWYYQEHLDRVERYTNPDNGQWVEYRESDLIKDLHITDNGDGTVSVLVLGVGPSSLRDSDGRLLARNDGTVRWIDTWDLHDPDDPEDDEFLGTEFVKESTGTNDDICATAVAALE